MCDWLNCSLIVLFSVSTHILSSLPLSRQVQTAFWKVCCISSTAAIWCSDHEVKLTEEKSNSGDMRGGSGVIYSPPGSMLMECLLLLPPSLSFVPPSPHPNTHACINTHSRKQNRECCPLVAHKRLVCWTHNASAADRNSILDRWLTKNSPAFHRSLHLYLCLQSWMGFTYYLGYGCYGQWTLHFRTVIVMKH